MSLVRDHEECVSVESTGRSAGAPSRCRSTYSTVSWSPALLDSECPSRDVPQRRVGAPSVPLYFSSPPAPRYVRRPRQLRMLITANILPPVPSIFDVTACCVWSSSPSPNVSPSASTASSTSPTSILTRTRLGADLHRPAPRLCLLYPQSAGNSHPKVTAASSPAGECPMLAHRTHLRVKSSDAAHCVASTASCTAAAGSLDPHPALSTARL